MKARPDFDRHTAGKKILKMSQYFCPKNHLVWDELHLLDYSNIDLNAKNIHGRILHKDFTMLQNENIVYIFKHCNFIDWLVLCPRQVVIHVSDLCVTKKGQKNRKLKKYVKNAFGLT